MLAYVFDPADDFLAFDFAKFGGADSFREVGSLNFNPLVNHGKILFEPAFSFSLGL